MSASNREEERSDGYGGSCGLLLRFGVPMAEFMTGYIILWLLAGVVFGFQRTLVDVNGVYGCCRHDAYLPVLV